MPTKKTTGKETKKTPAKKTTGKSTSGAAKTSKKAAMKEPQGEWLSGLIETPKGGYSPQSDDLAAELRAAARFSGLSKFKVFVNGTQILSDKDLPCKLISELPEIARVAGLDAPTAKISQYDKAG